MCCVEGADNADLTLVDVVKNIINVYANVTIYEGKYDYFIERTKHISATGYAQRQCKNFLNLLHEVSSLGEDSNYLPVFILSADYILLKDNCVLNVNSRNIEEFKQTFKFENFAPSIGEFIDSYTWRFAD